MPAFRELLVEIAQIHGSPTLLGHRSVVALATLNPPVLNHDKLKAPEYRPGQEVPAQLR